MNRRVAVDGRILQLTNLTKQLWPEYTKAKLIEYYHDIAPYLIPYLKDRAISLVRYPDGIYGKFFYQKDRPQGTPDWVITIPVYSKDTDKYINYLLVNDLPTLLFVANLAAIELGPWHSRAITPDHPDWTVIDLDPAEPAGFSQARQAALLTKQVLDHLNLIGYPKISGATGIHIYLRLPSGWSYQDSAKFAGFVGKLLRQLHPALITTERMIKNRTGKVYVDHLQNLKGKTIVAPFSLRPTLQATISMPITWAELETAVPQDFTLGNYHSRLGLLNPDPFHPILADLSAQGVVRMERLRSLAKSVEFANISGPGG